MLRGAVKGGGKVEEVSCGARGKPLFGAQFHLIEVHARYSGRCLGASGGVF